MLCYIGSPMFTTDSTFRQLLNSALPSVLIDAQPQSASPAGSLAERAGNGVSPLWAAGPGCPGRFLCAAHSKRTWMLWVCISLTLGGPQKYIKPRSKRAAGSTPAFSLTVVTVRKPHCASEKQLLNCSQNTPEARQDGHEPGTSRHTWAPFTGDALFLL